MTIVHFFSDADEAIAILNVEQIYFRLTSQCIWKQHPAVKCSKWDHLKEYPDVNRCRVYFLDTTKDKEYALFDVPFAVDDGAVGTLNKVSTKNFKNKNKYEFALDDIV